MEPPRVLWPVRSRGLLPIKPQKAGVMIPLEVLNRKSLFSLLFKIDQDLAERTRAKRCPFAGVHCMTPITRESLGADPLIFKRHLRFDSVYAAVVPVVVAVCCHLRFVSGIAGFTGRLCFYWSVRFARDKNLRSPWSTLSRFAAYGVQPLIAGNATLKNFLFRVTVTGACPDVFLPRSILMSCPERYCRVFTQSMVESRQLLRTAYEHLP